jgi:CRISPR/Cas system-associated exonuclease Cas4 (RecB family)
MEIKYIGPSERPEILSGCVYVTDNLEYIKETYEKKDILEKNPIFFKEGSFIESLFPPVTQVLKEEKETVCFYRSLTKQDKKKLKINNYYDCIDISGEFFKFYKELNDYNLKLESDFFQETWRREIFDVFENIKKNMENFLIKENYHIAFNRKIEAFDDYLIKGSKKIKFFNKLFFTPFEKSMVELLEGKGYEVELILQVKKEEFDEKNLKLSKLAVSQDKSMDIKVYEIVEEMEAYAKLGIGEAKDVVMKNLGEKGLSLKMNPKYCTFNPDSFENTKMFKVLSIFLELLRESDSRNGDFRIKYKSFFNSSYDEIFGNYFEFGILEKDKLRELAERGYKLISKNIFQGEDEAKYKKIISCLEELECLSNFSSIFEFKKYFSGENSNFVFKYNKLYDRYFDSFNIFIDEITQIESIETLNLFNIDGKPWEGFFENSGEGILRLILKYLQFNTVSMEKEEEGQRPLRFLDFDKLQLKKRERLVFIGLNEGEIPSKKSESFLLYDQERKDLGLSSYEERRLKEKFKFFSNIHNAQHVELYVLKNEEKNITSSSFVEELVAEKGLYFEKLPPVNYSDFMENKFKKSDINPGVYIGEEDYLEKDERDSLSISYYQYRNIEECLYRYYLKDVSKLREFPEIIEKMDLMSLGSLTHVAFEIVSNELKGYIESGNIDSVDLEEISSIAVDRAFFGNPLKSPTKYYHYYEKVLIPILKKSISKFFRNIFKRYSEIESFNPEYKVGKDIFEIDNVKIRSTGRVDLTFRSGIKEVLVDFKTGKGGLRQLDYYSYSLFGDNNSDKYIYSVLDEKLSNIREKGEKELTLDDMREVLEGFIGDERYRRTDKKKNCYYCEYKDICKMNLGE